MIVLTEYSPLKEWVYDVMVSLSGWVPVQRILEDFSLDVSKLTTGEIHRYYDGLNNILTNWLTQESIHPAPVWVSIRFWTMDYAIYLLRMIDALPDAINIDISISYHVDIIQHNLQLLDEDNEFYDHSK